ncbi:YkvA family protein [Desulfonatronum thiodismutans]|jgi:uncharacterized membrane protein YkvA (DUF1232 family)|uniref:YkvA family protein n=1 Tax=Desulfonatronum thiodismutans TaxID=159290 RepID=UPI000ABB1EC0|nr:YkvA family protein [Desulfonatronum thiodismutans]
MMKPLDMEQEGEIYRHAYSEESFWDKVVGYAKAAGHEVIEKALWLYYAAQKPTTPAWAKGVVYGALGYFIMPFDVIPDFTPVVGYMDDLGVLAAAVATVSMYIDDDVKETTKRKLREWFGE